jgi:hypothetical protein
MPFDVNLRQLDPAIEAALAQAGRPEAAAHAAGLARRAHENLESLAALVREAAAARERVAPPASSAAG